MKHVHRAWVTGLLLMQFAIFGQAQKPRLVKYPLTKTQEVEESLDEIRKIEPMERRAKANEPTSRDWKVSG
jgi:hypothetical protein